MWVNGSCSALGSGFEGSGVDGADEEVVVVAVVGAADAAVVWWWLALETNSGCWACLCSGCVSSTLVGDGAAAAAMPSKESPFSFEPPQPMFLSWKEQARGLKVVEVRIPFRPGHRFSKQLDLHTISPW